MGPIYRLEELTFPELDALDRQRTVVIFAVSPLEEHGPHLPLGVDAFTLDYFARAMAERIVTERPGWSVILAPPLQLGSWLVEAPGSVRIRHRTLRNLLIEYGSSLARHGFKYLLMSNGHAGPGHLVALEEAALSARHSHSIFYRIPVLRTNFWRYLVAGAIALAGLLTLYVWTR